MTAAFAAAFAPSQGRQLMAFTLGLIQLQANSIDVDHLDLAMAAVRAAARAGAQICILPELFRSPYFCQDMDPRHFDRAEAVPGVTTDRLAGLASELQIVIIASLFELAAPGLYYNTTAVLDADGTYLGKYRKTHIPNDPQYEEKFYFTPGDNDFKVFQTKYARVGVLICWDQWFAEAARLTSMHGAEVLVYPTAIGTIDGEPADEQARQIDAWQTVQRGHAIANGVYVAAVNRVGREPGPNGGIDFWGRSFCAGPQGEILASASEHKAHTLLIECSAERIRDVRNMWPFFRDRRVDLYQGLQRRFFDDTTK